MYITRCYCLSKSSERVWKFGCFRVDALNFFFPLFLRVFSISLIVFVAPPVAPTGNTHHGQCINEYSVGLTKIVQACVCRLNDPMMDMSGARVSRRLQRVERVLKRVCKLFEGAWTHKQAGLFFKWDEF